MWTINEDYDHGDFYNVGNSTDDGGKNEWVDVFYRILNIKIIVCAAPMPVDENNYYVVLTVVAITRQPLHYTILYVQFPYFYN